MAPAMKILLVVLSDPFRTRRFGKPTFTHSDHSISKTDDSVD